MTSILTNTSSMVALQTLRNINTSLNKVQAEISTGKKVANARESAAIWAISKVMEADVKGFKGISDSLALGASTLQVAREAAESIYTMLTDIKSKIVTAQGENVDRSKLQTDIAAARQQIMGIVSTAQFSGLNLVSGSEDVNFLASLDRSASGVTVSDITVRRQDLSTTAGVFGSGAALTAHMSIVNAAAAATNAGKTAVLTFTGVWDTSETATITIDGESFTYTATADGTTADAVAGFLMNQIADRGLVGITATAVGGALTVTSTRSFEGVNVVVTDGAAAGALAITAVNGAAPAAPNTGTNSTIAQRAEQFEFSNAVTVQEGNSYRVTLGSANYDYVARKGDTMEDVARGLKIAIDSANLTGVNTAVTQTSTGAWRLSVDNDNATALSLATATASGGTASGGLFGLSGIDVTTDDGARRALENIEGMINRAVDAAADFGSAQNRIDTQRSFVATLVDALTSGIGALVDADMEEASARLQALQVQQQLGIQALAIANQQPQNLLSLFR